MLSATKQKGSVGEISAHPVHASTSDGHQARIGSSQGFSNGAVAPATRQSTATRTARTRAKVSDNSAALESAGSFSSCDTKDGSSSIMQVRTRAQTQALEEKPSVRNKPETRASVKLVGAGVARNAASRGESGKKCIRGDAAATLFTHSKSLVTKIAKKRVASKNSTGLPVESETLRGSVESSPTTSGDIHEQILQAETLRITRGRAAAMKSLTTAHVVPGGSKLLPTTVNNEIGAAGQARKTRSVCSKPDRASPTTHRDNTAKAKKALPRGKARKRPGRNRKGVAEPEPIISWKRISMWKRNFKGRTRAPSTKVDDLFAEEHGTQHTLDGTILALLSSFDPADEELEAANSCTCPPSSPQGSSAQRSFSNTGSTEPSIDVDGADENACRTERLNENVAAATLPSPSTSLEPRVEQWAFLKKLDNAERERLDLGWGHRCKDSEEDNF